MSRRLLFRIREFVRSGHYVVTLHASEEMEADGLSLDDVEHCILNGKVVQRQRDRETGEGKYLIHGSSLDGVPAGVVAKIGPTGKLVVITAYAI